MSSDWSNIVLILLQAGIAYITSRAHKQSVENFRFLAYHHDVIKTQNAQLLEQLKTISGNQLYRN